MAEDKGLCTHFKYHKHKLVLFLSAMRSHADEIRKNHDIKYTQLDDKDNQGKYVKNLEKVLKQHGIKEIVTYKIEDKFFKQEIEDFSKSMSIQQEQKDSPGFMNSPDDFEEYLENVSGPFMHNYYIRQRKKLGLLLDNKGKPLHGKWSFDKENRKKLPADIQIPERPRFKATRHTTEVKKLVNSVFPDHPGNTDDFNYGTTRNTALRELKSFLTERFNEFGPYEDAMDKKRRFIFHSVLSPYLNTGLLTPAEVIEAAVGYGLENNIHFPSIEGFVRQIAGWREFMRGMYHFYDLKNNYFNHNNSLTGSWYHGTTGIDPLDNIIRKVKKHAYAHHIERLMVLGNIMLLSEIHPDEVYRWFMEMFIDSADWVMVPNVYGMSQFADGGKFATKPYIAGSNYILKISNYDKGEWTDTVDGLYWRFVDKNRDFLRKNARMGVMVKSFERMKKERKKNILKKAETFIRQNT